MGGGGNKKGIYLRNVPELACKVQKIIKALNKKVPFCEFSESLNHSWHLGQFPLFKTY